MITNKTLNSLNGASTRTIITNSYIEAQTGQPQPHSINTIVRQERDIGIANRLTTKPLNLRIFNDNGTPTTMYRTYTADDIAYVFKSSATQFGYTYYPITGDINKWQWKPNTLVLFIRNKQRKQVPTLKFEILQIIDTNILTAEMLAHITDVTPILNMHFNSILKIGNPNTNFAPDQSYIGLTSGADIYESAFKGSNPLTMIL